MWAGGGEVCTCECWVFCSILCCSDNGQEFVPPLRHQNSEELWLHWATFECSKQWLYQSASWCSGGKCSHWDVLSDRCLEVDGCSSVDGQQKDSGGHRGRGSHGRIWVDWKQGMLQCSGYAASDFVDSDWQVYVRAVFPWDEEEFSFIRVEFEVMCSCPSSDFCQTFRDCVLQCGYRSNSWVLPA